MKIIKEFKEFAIKGNVFDIAIGIIIGTAFGKVVSSLVNDLLLPPLGFLIDKVDFKNLAIVIKEAEKDNAGLILQEAIAINYGNFIQTIINFLIIAFSIFVVIRIFNRIRNKAEDTKDQTIPTPKNIEILAEIRDLLKKNKNETK